MLQSLRENDRIKAELKFFGKTVKRLNREEFEEALYCALAGEYTREEQSRPQSVVWSIPEAEFEELYRKAQNEELKTAEAWEAELARLRKRYGIPEPRPEEIPETETEGPETEETPPPEGPEEEETPPRQKSEEEDIPETEQPESDRIVLKHQATSGVKLVSTPGQTTTILGRYVSDTSSIIAELSIPKNTNFDGNPGGFNLLNTPDDLYDKLGPGEYWNQYNRPFLDAAIKRGDCILMATPVNNSTLYTKNGELTGYGKEYFYLLAKGYHYVNGRMMMKGNHE